MTHNEVYKNFPFGFVNFNEEDVDIYFPCGRNTIRIRLKNQREYIFTFNTNKD